MVPVLVLGNNSVTVAGPGPLSPMSFCLCVGVPSCKGQRIGRRCPKNCSKERARGAD